MRRLLPLLLVAVLAAACADASADEGALLPALCEAVDAPDAATAAEVFEAEAHTPLHTLADEVAAVDRPLATRLLEAKFAVETVVRTDQLGPAPLVRERLQVLADRTREALQVLDRPAPAC